MKRIIKSEKIVRYKKCINELINNSKMNLDIPRFSDLAKKYKVDERMFAALSSTEYAKKAGRKWVFYIDKADDKIAEEIIDKIDEYYNNIKGTIINPIVVNNDEIEEINKNREYKGLLNKKQACEYTGLSIAGFNSAIKNGRIKRFVKIGKRDFFYSEDMQFVMSNHRKRFCDPLGKAIRWYFKLNEKEKERFKEITL